MQEQRQKFNPTLKELTNKDRIVFSKPCQRVWELLLDIPREVKNIDVPSLSTSEQGGVKVTAFYITLE